MKLACSSTAFDEPLRSGDLTQLEWIDLCAHELAADGVVFDVRHFPRTDADYLAQVKKMATDLGLCVAALRDDALFDAEDARVEQAAGMALALGAPLISAPLPAETAASWNDVQQRLGTATSTAKRHNVTIALRNAPQTFAAGSHDMKRVSKEADSAWLRYGPNFSALEAGSNPQDLLAKSVLVWQSMRHAAQDGLLAIVPLLKNYRGFVAFDEPDGTATVAQFIDAARAWRTAN